MRRFVLGGGIFTAGVNVGEGGYLLFCIFILIYIAIDFLVDD